MPEISLTEFVDFVIKSGTPKLTAVRRIKEMHADEYHPTRDYWKALRDGIVQMHEEGQPKSTLDDIVRGVKAANKQKNYPVLAQAYKKWLGRKSAEWFTPPRAEWQHNVLTVRINPELGLTIDGKPHLVKLYFKDQKLTKERIALISKMMLDTVGPKADKTCVALLDVRNSRLHAFDTADAALLPLLEGEALSFCRMYEGG